MPRKKPLINAGVVHHVMSRGIDGMVLFRDNEGWEKIRSLFKKVFIDGVWQCYAWVLIDNREIIIYQNSRTPG